MTSFARLLAAFTGVLLMLALVQSPAMAATESGTHAWSTDTLALRNGPGTNYDISGEISADLAIKVLRCQKLWCLVDGDEGRGWTYKRNISFGKTTANDWPNTSPVYPRGGTICLYTGTNYSGTEYCLTTGQTIRDLAMLDLDNSFTSIRIESTSVDACRDRDFQSYCERIIQSQPVLDQYLRGALSSIKVY